jgi:hypothetical protein
MRRTFIRSLLTAVMLLALAVPGASALTPPAPPPPGTVPANTPRVPFCEHVDGAHWCVVLSTTYPKTVGNYGWVGVGQPCGPTPLPGWFGSTAPMIGICAMPPPQPVWKWSATGWVADSLPVGASVYVHSSPWKDWRWIWTSTTNWALMPADTLLLKWRIA